MDFVQFLVEYYRAIWNAVATTWWFVFPIAFFWTFKELYWRHMWREYGSTVKWTLLEVKPPRNIERSPRTMEQIFMVLHGVWSTPSYFEMYFIGRQFQSIFSFEIQGVNGEMHFYIRTETRYRNLVEAAIYSQYPEAEIDEVEDYALTVPSSIPNSEWNLWGTDYEFAKDDAYPIRTYHKFQEDVTKGMIEPLGVFADAISSIPPGHQIWLQILIRPIKDNVWTPAVKKVVDKLANREAKKESGVIAGFFTEVADILVSSVKYIFNPVEEKKEEKKDEAPLQFRLTPVEKDTLQAVEESLNKKAFKTKLRVVYVAPKETFKKIFYQSVDGFIYQFNDPNLNAFKKNADTKTYANYFFRKYRTLWSQRKIFRRYVTRDNDGPNMYLNTEELATIWHLPDMSAMSPAIARIEAKKGGAPLNLPVE